MNKVTIISEHIHRMIKFEGDLSEQTSCFNVLFIRCNGRQILEGTLRMNHDQWHVLYGLIDADGLKIIFAEAMGDTLLPFEAACIDQMDGHTVVPILKSKIEDYWHKGIHNGY